MPASSVEQSRDRSSYLAFVYKTVGEYVVIGDMRKGIVITCGWASHQDWFPVNGRKDC